MTNFDQAEVNKFDALATRWWDPNGPLKTLHDINPLRQSFISKHATLFDKPTLDVGCGGGILSESLAKLGATVTAIDKAPELIKVAQMHQFESDLSIDYQVADLQPFSEANAGKFQVITCMELLEHVPDPKSLLEDVVRCAAPGADIFLSTLNRNLKSYAFAILGAEYVLQMLPKGTHDFQKFIKPSELCNWARALDVQPQATQGLHYNPLTQQYSLSNDISVNYLIHFKKAA